MKKQKTRKGKNEENILSKMRRNMLKLFTENASSCKKKPEGLFFILTQSKEKFHDKCFWNWEIKKIK